MQDNDLVRLFLPIITGGLVAAGYTGIKVIQANQPRQQGVALAPTVYYYKISDHRYGFLKRADTWNEAKSEMTHIEDQNYETVFQISALAIQNPAVTNSFTASDLVNSVAQIMQSDTTRATLLASNVGIYRITGIRNPYFIDDMDRYEASPSFDFTLTHHQVSSVVIPVIESCQLEVDRI